MRIAEHNFTGLFDHLNIILCSCSHHEGRQVKKRHIFFISQPYALAELKGLFPKKMDFNSS